MLADHERIVAAIRDLADAATREGKRGYAGLSEKLLLHLRAEEQPILRRSWWVST
jgi:hypothetical protein